MRTARISSALVALSAVAAVLVGCNSATTSGQSRGPVVSATPQVTSSPALVNDSPKLREKLPAKPKVKNRVIKGKMPMWSAWLLKKQLLPRATFAKAFEENDRKILRVDVKEFARLWANLGLPVTEDPKQIAGFLRSKDVTEVRCTNKLLKGFYMARVDLRSGKTDFNYERRACYKGEVFLAYKGVPFVSLGCGNPMRKKEKPKPKPTPAPVPTATVADSGCPAGRHILKANVWPKEVQRMKKVKVAIAKAEADGDMRDPSRLSRFLGGMLRRQAGEANGIQRSETPRLFRVSLIRVDAEDKIIPGSEKILREIEVTGLQELGFTESQMAGYDAIRFVDVREEMRSPVLHSHTGLKELRFYISKRFQGRLHGEWDLNPTPEDCTMNVHFVEADDRNRFLMF